MIPLMSITRNFFMGREVIPRAGIRGISVSGAKRE